MRQKLNLKDKCQISKPNEYTDNVKSNLTCIFLSVRAKLKKALCPRTLCRPWQVLSSRSYYHIFGLVLTETGKEENGLFTFKVNESMKARILHTQKKF